MAWTVEVVADGKGFDMGDLSFSTSGQLLATARVDGGVEIWNPIKGKCLRTIVCDQLSAINSRNWNFRLTDAFWRQHFRMVVCVCTLFRAKLDATKPGPVLIGLLK
jgi:hypothetical protein